MEAIEFKAKIKNGMIRIPDKFRQKTGDTVKVIILSEQKSGQTDIIDKLLLHPVKCGHQGAEQQAGESLIFHHEGSPLSSTLSPPPSSVELVVGDIRDPATCLLTG